MRISKVPPKFGPVIVSLACVLTFVLFVGTVIGFVYGQKSQEKSLWPDEVFIIHFAVQSFLAAMCLHMVWQYIRREDQKRKIGMLLAAMTGIPSIYILCVCWVWIIGLVITYIGGTWRSEAPFSFLFSAFWLYGCAWIILLAVCAVAAIVSKIVSAYRRKRTPRQKSRIIQRCLRGGAIAFGILTVAVLLHGLNGFVQSSPQLLSQRLLDWQKPTAILYVCLAMIAGIDLFLGMGYMLGDLRKKTSVGVALLSLGSLSSFVIWVEAAMMRSAYVSPEDRSFCLYIGVLQMVVTLLLHGVAAVQYKRKMKS